MEMTSVTRWGDRSPTADDFANFDELDLFDFDGHAVYEPAEVFDNPAEPQLVPADNAAKVVPLTTAQRHSTAQWDRMRPVIAQYYLGQGMKLRDVIHKLEADHNFSAT